MGERAVGSMVWKLALLTVVLSFTLYTSFNTLDEGEWRLHHVIGLAILVPSFCLWALARRQLGASFAVRPEARRLVTHGLYARIQHPIYVFGWLFNAGLFTFLGIWPLFIVLVILVPVQLLRIHREQRVLQSAFGEAYREYRRQTWF